MAGKIYHNPEFFGEWFQGLNDLRKSEKTCDICLIVSNKKIYAHKMILAAGSKFLKIAVYGPLFNQVGRTELPLARVEYEIFPFLLDYMYTGKIDINSKNVYDIYDAADYYMMPFLKEVCLEFLQENLNTVNCVKTWTMAKKCQSDPLISASKKFIFSNLDSVSKTEGFLRLSHEEILDIFELRQKDELYDSIITSIIRWAVKKDNAEDIVMKFLKDIPNTSISEDYVGEYLYNNEFIQSSMRCTKWIMNIFKENTKIHKIKQAATLAEANFTKFLSEKPIIFMHESGNDFYKYNSVDAAFNPYNKINDLSYRPSSCEAYKKWIYVVGERYCERFAHDDLNTNKLESAFRHNHGYGVSSAIFSDSIYLFGGDSSKNKGSSINLNTEQSSKFNLLHDFRFAGVAVSDGAIYICGGLNTNNVERFDPREGINSQVESIPFQNNIVDFYSATGLSNKIYCANESEYKMLDLRNSNIWTDINPPVEKGFAYCLISSYGKVYTVNRDTLYEYNNESELWQNNRSFPELSRCYCATSFT